jgi:Transposase
MIAPLPAGEPCTGNDAGAFGADVVAALRNIAKMIYQRLQIGPLRGEQRFAVEDACPIPEVARLGRTPRAWKGQILAYFDTHGVSDGGTEAINLRILLWARTSWPAFGLTSWTF